MKNQKQRETNAKHNWKPYKQNSFRKKCDPLLAREAEVQQLRLTKTEATVKVRQEEHAKVQLEKVGKLQ